MRRTRSGAERDVELGPVGGHRAAHPAGRVVPAAHGAGLDGTEQLPNGVVDGTVAGGQHRQQRPGLLGVGFGGHGGGDLAEPLVDAVGVGQEERRPERTAAGPATRPGLGRLGLQHGPRLHQQRGEQHLGRGDVETANPTTAERA